MKKIALSALLAATLVGTSSFSSAPRAYCPRL